MFTQFQVFEIKFLNFYFKLTGEKSVHTYWQITSPEREGSKHGCVSSPEWTWVNMGEHGWTWVNMGEHGWTWVNMGVSLDQERSAVDRPGPPLLQLEHAVLCLQQLSSITHPSLALFCANIHQYMGYFKIWNFKTFLWFNFIGSVSWVLTLLDDRMVLKKEIWKVERCVRCLPLWGQDRKQERNKNQNIPNRRNIQNTWYVFNKSG